MDITVSQQTIIFLSCALCGVVLGVLFDLFRAFRRLISIKTSTTHVQDILYWLLTTVVAFVFFVFANRGEIRIYMLIGALLGAYLYLVSVSDLFIRFVVAATIVVKKTLVVVTRVVLAPVLWVIRLLRRPFFLVIRLGRSGGRRMKQQISGNWFFYKKFLKKV